MLGQELPRLYNPARVHVTILTTELSECIYGSDLSPAPFLVTDTLSFGGIFESRCFSCTKVLEPSDVCQSVYHSPQTTVLCVGKVWH